MARWPSSPARSPAVSVSERRPSPDDAAAPRATPQGAHGLGLEMPIAKAIVEAHDGSLHYEASPHSFRVLIDLPLNLAA
mgnify:CR=1 FL=1